jgi:hypothetical protein
MKSIWTTNYEGNEIKIVNTWFNGESLFVNGHLQDHRFAIFSSHLTGHVFNQKNERENIKVTLGGALTMNCMLFIDDKKIDLTQEK